MIIDLSTKLLGKLERDARAKLIMKYKGKKVRRF
jgi:hypothetical protein